MTLRRLRLYNRLSMPAMARALSRVPGARLSLRAYYLLERAWANDNGANRRRTPRLRRVQPEHLPAP